MRAKGQERIIKAKSFLLKLLPPQITDRRSEPELFKALLAVISPSQGVTAQRNLVPGPGAAAATAGAGRTRGRAALRREDRNYEFQAI